MERYIQDANFEEYFDFAQVTEAELEHLVAEGKIEPPGEGDPTFPARLNYMLDEVDTDGFGEVVSWQPHGRSFLIHNQKRFKEEVLPLVRWQLCSSCRKSALQGIACSIYTVHHEVSFVVLLIMSLPS